MSKPGDFIITPDPDAPCVRLPWRSTDAVIVELDQIGQVLALPAAESDAALAPRDDVIDMKRGALPELGQAAVSAAPGITFADRLAEHGGKVSQVRHRLGAFPIARRAAAVNRRGGESLVQQAE